MDVFPNGSWRANYTGMFLLVDREAMCVRYRHPHQNTLASVMAIEFTNTAVACMGDNQAESYEQFTDLELKLLYLNLTGQKYTGYSRDILIKTVMALVQQIEPDSDLNGFELSLQANHIKDGEEGFFKRAVGGTAPILMPEVYAAKPRTPRAGYTPPPTPTPPVNAAPARATQAAAPVPRSELPASAPKAGSTTGRVWEIAEGLWRAMMDATNTINPKELRKQIVTACESEGINGSTASVQYGKWRTTKGF